MFPATSLLIFFLISFMFQGYAPGVFECLYNLFYTLFSNYILCTFVLPLSYLCLTIFLFKLYLNRI